MTTMSFDGKEFVHICYQDNILKTKEADSLDYVSKTLYGHIKIQVKALSQTDSDEFEELIRYVQGDKILEQDLRVLQPIESFPINNYFYVDYPIYINGMSCFGNKKDVFTTYCYRMKPPKNSIFFLIEDEKGTRICYEYYNSRDRKFIEIGSFVIYENEDINNKGIRFFPLTKIATRMRDFVF